MPSFMMEIDAARPSPLDQLAIDYFARRRLEASLTGGLSIGFCRQVAGVPETDQVVASRLGVSTSMVREWRELGLRAGSRRP